MGWILITGNFPPNFQPDQARIAARMVSVLTAAQQGVDPKTGPFPTREMPLAAALAEIESLRDQEK